MKRIPQILLLLLVMVATSAAQGQTIKANTEAKRGLPVHLEVEGDGSWDVVSWKVDWPLDFQKGKHYFENGSHFYSAIPCDGVDRIKVGVTVINWDSKIFKQLDYSIDIGDKPTPVDPPPKDPPTDPPAEDYTKSPVYAPLLAEVKKIQDKTNAGKAADNFEAVANMVSSGEIETTIGIWRAVANRNVRDLGDARQHWQDIGKLLQDEFADLNPSEFKGYAFHLHAVALAIREGIK